MLDVIVLEAQRRNMCVWSEFERREVRAVKLAGKCGIIASYQNQMELGKHSDCQRSPKARASLLARS